MQCDTWATYSVGQHCIAMANPVSCMEGKPPDIATIIQDGPKDSKVLDDGVDYKDQPTIIKICVLFFQVTQKGIVFRNHWATTWANPLLEQQQQ